MKVAKWISAGILLVIVLFLSIYALFPEEAAEPVVSRIAIESASGSQENTASTRSLSDEVLKVVPHPSLLKELLPPNHHLRKLLAKLLFFRLT